MKGYFMGLINAYTSSVLLLPIIDPIFILLFVKENFIERKNVC